MVVLFKPRAMRTKKANEKEIKVGYECTTPFPGHPTQNDSSDGTIPTFKADITKLFLQGAR